ncbi:MAG: hypothetical protein HY055_00755 [Magnetospirillum sp.]|nr:hypothetical protein [Magnetospirillum sp.]
MHALFYNGASFASETIIARLRDSLGLTEVTLVDHQPAYEVEGVRIHRMHVDDVMYLDYPTSIHDCAPLEESVVMAMAQCEIQCLTMFDKAAKVGRRQVWQRRRIRQGQPFFRDLNTTETYDRRKFQYLTHLRYWNDYLDRHPIDFYMMGTVPYAMWDYILYELCKQRGIPTLLFQHLLIDGYSLPVTSIEGPNQQLQDTIGAVAEEFAGREHEIQLCERSEVFIRKQTDKTKDPHPEYYDMSLNEYAKGDWRSAYIYVKAMVKGLLVEQPGFNRRQWLEYLSCDFWLRTLKDMEMRTLWKYWDAHADFRIDGTPFVYVALAYQPEVSTCPSGGVFTNQELMIQALAKSLPEGAILAVKEHPAQKSLSRTIDFYQWLVAEPRVRLVPRNYNTYRLIESATAVATTTGSIIMESLFRQTPVMAFGEHNAVYAPGVFRVRNGRDVAAAFKAIFEDGVKPSLAGTRVFIGALERLWFRCDNWGRVTEPLMKFSGLTHEENGIGLADAFAHTYRSLTGKPGG